MITELGLIEINKKFDKGVIINKSSLDFALSYAKNTKDWVKQVAFLLRALLVDHIFQEGNKRTGSALLLYYFETHKVGYDPYKVNKVVAEIASKNISSVEQIRRKLKDVIR